jgi:hypothetical protein
MRTQNTISIACGRILRSTVIFLAAFLLTDSPAHAYLDPGAGSFATQILVAGIAGTLFTVRSFFARFLRSRRSESDGK